VTTPAGERAGTRGGGDQPLSDVVVVDLGEGVAAPYCTKLLADYGARVVKVEPPGGDPARRLGPFRGDAVDIERSGTFLALNTNKDGIVVDTTQAAGAQVVRDLVMAADVLVESSRPGTLASRGLAPDDLLAARPALVVSSITPFGQTGPYRDYDMTEIVACAMGGPMNASGNPAREPVKLAGNVVQVVAGSQACVATLGALWHAVGTGEGQHVDVAWYETQNGNVDRRRYYLLSYQYCGQVTQRTSTLGASRASSGGRFTARDGRLVTTGRLWYDHIPRMVAIVDDPELNALWERLGEEMCASEAAAVNAALARWFAVRDAREAMREAQARGWPVVVVNDPRSLLTDEHFVARGFWREADHPVAGTLAYCGPPWQTASEAWRLQSTAPTLGQHTDAVLRELAGYDDTYIAALRADGVIA
jgi:crotonobetainyl-CoA:carnitine CoA-transferase CaiB-like acyl-CoA transferase